MLVYLEEDWCSMRGVCLVRMLVHALECHGPCLALVGAQVDGATACLAIDIGGRGVGGQTAADHRRADRQL